MWEREKSQGRWREGAGEPETEPWWAWTGGRFRGGRGWDEAPEAPDEWLEGGWLKVWLAVEDVLSGGPGNWDSPSVEVDEVEVEMEEEVEGVGWTVKVPWEGM